MKLAIITCSKLPQGVKDDQGLFNALNHQGIQVDIQAWDADIDWSGYHACLLRSVWDYHERSEEFITWLKTTNQQTPIINSADMVEWNTHKGYLKELAEFGVSIAPTLWLDQGQTYAIDQLTQTFNTSYFFIKPVIGADSSGTFRFTNSHKDVIAAQQHLNSELLKNDMMLQPYFSMVETYGETSGIFFDGMYSHGVRKIPVDGDFRVQDTFGATDVAYTLSPIEMALSKACLAFLKAKFGRIIYARFDFLHAVDGSVYLNEAELFEPSLFFNHSQDAATLFAKAIKKRLLEVAT